MRLRNIMLTSLAAVTLAAASYGLSRDNGDGPRPRPVIFVTSQGLYYDSIVAADPIPPFGPFQVLEMGPNGLQTEFGKGDRGYVGGRWVEDIDGDGIPHYFVCPLLGQGRTTP
jgi:hypothetical protein